MEDNVMDCSKYCSVLDKEIAIRDKIKKLEEEHVHKTYSKDVLDKHTKLNQKIESLNHTRAECMMDCERRNLHRIQGKEPPQIDDTLRKELEDSDDDDLDGGNKRRRRRRSFRNKTKRTQRRGRQQQRNQKRNTRR